MKKLLFVLCIALSFGAISAEMKAYHTPGVPNTVTLDNGLLKLSFVPELNGSLCAWEYQPTGHSIIRPMKYHVEKVDLLPDRVSASKDGFRCRVWESNRKITDSMRVKKLTATPAEGCTLVLHSPLTGGTELDLTSELRLLPGSTLLNGKITLINRQNAAGRYSLWFNAVFAMCDKPEPVLVPVRSKVDRIGKLGMVFAEEDGILSELHDGNRNMYFAALRPWIAKKAVDRPGVAVLEITDSQVDKMIFYTHKSALLHTMEILAPSMPMAKGVRCVQEFRIFYFPSLTSLREICGNFGVDIKDGCLEIESAVPVGKSIWSISGKDYPVPALQPGKLHKIKLQTAPGKNLKISVNGKEFTLPGMLTSDLKKAY